MPHACHCFGHATEPSRFARFWHGAHSLAPATRNDIWTSKSGASMWCFVHFDFEMCFAPQRRALFRHLNFQKWSDTGVFCAFWLRNVLCATTACTFSTSQLPKVVRTWCALYILTWKCASRRNSVHFSSLIWPDGSAPAAFASLLFDPPEPQIIGKTQCFAAFLPFRASASSFFWLFLFYHLLSSALLFSLPLPISAFHLSILSEVWLLNFLRWLYLFIYLLYFFWYGRAWSCFCRACIVMLDYSWSQRAMAKQFGHWLRHSCKDGVFFTRSVQKWGYNGFTFMTLPSGNQT